MMRIIILCLSLFYYSTSNANEWRGNISLEGRYFLHQPIHSGQEEHAASVSFSPEYYHQNEAGNQFNFKPFFRYDSADKERSHVDIRTLSMLYLWGDAELHIGLRQVFWGVTESQHLVDIINQSDAVEYIDREDKLGQPMIYFSLAKDWGIIDLFALPIFREQTFPGVNGRLRLAQVIDVDNAVYESSAETYHFDYAIRFSQTVGDWDIGLSWFHGTSRDPAFLPRISTQGQFSIVPFYEIIKQIGIDVQWIYEGWLWKLELINRRGQSNRMAKKDEYKASTFGFEYTYTGLFESNYDLGLITEWLYDERGKLALNANQNDILLGMRWAMNNANSSELLAGMLLDINSQAKAFTIEASTRFKSNWKIELNAVFFSTLSQDEVLFDLRDDDLIEINLAYYF